MPRVQCIASEPRSRSGAASVGIAVGAFALIVADLPGLSSWVWAPKMAVLMVMGAAGLPVLVLRAIAGRKSTAGPPAIAALVFVAVAVAATASSGALVAALVGAYNQGTGLVFVVAIAGVWALGTLIDDRGRPLVERAIVAGAVVNSVVALAQVAFGPSALLAALGTHATGFLGNPVFLGAVCVAALALLGGRFVDDPRRWAVSVALIGAGIGASAERLPVLMMLGVFAAEGLVALWRRRSGTGSLRLARLVGFAGSGAAGWLIGSVLYPLVHGGGVTGAGAIGYAAQSTTQSTFGDRLDIWRVAATAIGHRPLIGYGPGQFFAATVGRLPIAFARSLGSAEFSDAHNIFIEYATTTGLLGLAALVGWLALAVRRRRGRLVLMAAVLLAIGLAEPQNVATTPLMLLGLGAATVAPSRRKDEGGVPDCPPGSEVPGGRIGRVAVLACGGAAAMAGLALIVGDVQYERAISLSAADHQAAAIRAATASDRELFAWPDPQSLVSQAELSRVAPITPESTAMAAIAAAEAARRDPTNPYLWGSLASAQIVAGDLGAAERSAMTGLRLDPAETGLLDSLGFIALRRGNTAGVDHWFGRSLVANPDQSLVRSILRHDSAGG